MTNGAQTPNHLLGCVALLSATACSLLFDGKTETGDGKEPPLQLVDCTREGAVVVCTGFDQGVNLGTETTRSSRLSTTGKRVWSLDPSWNNVEGLIGLWHFDEEEWNGTPDEVRDSAGFEWHGRTIGEDFSTTKAGRFESAAHFINDGSYIKIDSDIPKALGDSWTFSAWILPSACAAGGSSLVSWVEATGATARLVCFDNKLGLSVKGSTQDPFETVIAVDRVLSDGRWHGVHVVTTPQDYSLYIDGVLEQRVSVETYRFGGNLFELQFGGHGDEQVDGDEYKGLLDEVAIWQRALQQEEISKISRRQNPESTGQFTSALFDAGESVQWSTLSVTPLAPYGKALGTDSEDDYPASPNATSNLVGLWPLNDAISLDDAGPSPIADETGANPGVVPMGKGRSVEGKVGAALELSGAASMPSVVGPEAALTVSLWLKSKIQGPEYDFAGCAFLKLRDGTGWSLETDLNNTESLVLYASSVGGSGEVPNLDRFNTVVFDDRWHHLVFVVQDGMRKGFVDGVLALSDPEYVHGTDFSAMGLQLGDDECVGWPTDRFPMREAVIDELAIWNRALDDSEMKSLYQRVMLDVRYQVRTCATPTCSAGEPFVGPNGPDSYFSESNRNNPTGLPSFDLSALPRARYIQYRALFSSEIIDVAPELQQVSLIGQ
jgi:hypothetical protein